MNYVKSFSLYGIDAAQVPCILGKGPPEVGTEGDVGCFYMDTDTGDVYKCTAAAAGVYTWTPLQSVSINVAIDDTLSAKGKAADAKAVGDALGDISAVLDAINGEVV